MRKTFANTILYGQMDDGGQSCQNLSGADGQLQPIRRSHIFVCIGTLSEFCHWLGVNNIVVLHSSSPRKS